MNCNLEIIFVYSTMPSHETAENIARILLEEKLAACINMFPIKSMYYWQDTLQSDIEIAVIAKTTAQQFLLLEKRVQ